jgi:hypothetical protein
MSSKIYTFDGDIHDISMPELYDGKPFFRKMTYTKELEICHQLFTLQKENKHLKNVVKIYYVGSNFVDMELLDETYGGKVLKKEEVVKIIEIMREVKTELQTFGILYIDWKIDNIGFSKTDNTYKLFDFDCSGIMDIETKEWKKKPKMYYSYTMAVTAGKETPLEIDDYIFEMVLIHYNQYLFH